MYLCFSYDQGFFFPTLGHLKNYKISWTHKNQNIHDVLSNKRKNSLQFIFLGASNLSQMCSVATINNYF